MFNVTAIKKLSAILCLALITSCSTLPKESQALDQVSDKKSPRVNSNELADATISNANTQGINVEYIDGHGRFLASERESSLPKISKNTEGNIDLNFLATDVRLVINAVLKEMLDKQYILEAGVKGDITLQSNRSLNETDVLMALEESLRLIKVAMVVSDGVYHIMPIAQAPRRIASIRRPVPASVNLPGFGVQAVSLSYTSPSEMVKVLEPFAAQGSILSVDNSRNLLILAGTAKELATLQELVYTFDVDWMKGMSFALFTLDNVDVKTMQLELAKIFNDASTPIKDLIKFVPISRLNALLAISHNREYLQQVEKWVHRLDMGGQTSGRKIYIYDVQNGKADAMGEALNQLFGSAGSATEPSNVEAQGSYNSSRSQNNTQDILQAGKLKIVPNNEDNSLLMLATPEEYGVIAAALKQMDNPARQVLIEATLAEVTLNDELKYGINWFLESGTNEFTFSGASSGAVASSFPGFSYFNAGSGSNVAVLNALDSVTDVNVVSSPKLMVMNNQTASLQVGDEVPVAVQSAQGTVGDSSPLVNTIEFRNTGVILEITPHINEGGLIVLEVSQEVSEVSETKSSGIDSPTIQQRKINSTIAVQNGETVALGGLIRETTTDARSGIPLLMSIPVLGGAFRSTSKVTRRTELLVLITPRVINNAYESNLALQSLKSEFKRLVPIRSALETN
ncbi:type II secretion system secretin GspD [Porticoccaceae bacterium]|nr:type II secretion system secretin GspD [Porticoccaceae bacterium]